MRMRRDQLATLRDQSFFLLFSKNGLPIGRAAVWSSKFIEVLPSPSAQTRAFPSHSNEWRTKSEYYSIRLAFNKIEAIYAGTAGASAALI